MMMKRQESQLTDWLYDQSCTVVWMCVVGSWFILGLDSGE